MRCLRLITLLTLALTQASCSYSQMIKPAPALFGGEATLPFEYARVLRDYGSAWRAKNASALAAMFDENGFVLTDGSPLVRGRANIEKHYADAGGPLHLRALAWAMQGAIGYVIGEYDQHADFANPGKFTLTLARDEGNHWVIFSDMDNGNTPPRPAPIRSPPASP